MNVYSGPGSKSFAHREFVAPVGLWERGAEASGYILPSARPLPKSEAGSLSPENVPPQEKHRAPKALATSPSGETTHSTNSAPAHSGKFHNKAKAAYEISDREIMAAMVGHDVGEDSYIESKIRKQQILDQSEAIVERLERCGLQGRSVRGGVSIVGLVSGQSELIPDYRNCNLIPVQQSRNVRDMLKHVRYMVDQTPKKNRLRMLVVSGGWCRYDEYRKYHKAHTRRMSRFAANPKLKEFGIKVEFYNVESTIHRAQGVAMLNMHSHVLFRSTRFLGSKKWKSFLEFARNFFPKGYVHDSKLEKPEEVVKYVFKPNELDLMNDPEFTEFAQQVMGGRCQVDPETGEILTRIDDDGKLVEVKEGPLTFFRPLGSMRKFRAELRNKRQKLISVRTADGRWLWHKTEIKAEQPRPEKEPENEERENFVLATTRPMPAFTSRMEPCFIVQGYCGNFNELVIENNLSRRVSEARAIFDERVRKDEEAAREAENASRGEAPSMKHTTTMTVPERSEAEGVKHPPPAHVSTKPPPKGGSIDQQNNIRPSQETTLRR